MLAFSLIRFELHLVIDHSFKHALCVSIFPKTHLILFYYLTN